MDKSLDFGVSQTSAPVSAVRGEAGGRMRIPGDFSFHLANSSLNSTRQLHGGRRHDQKIHEPAADPDPEQLFTERHQEEKRWIDRGGSWIPLGMEGRDTGKGEIGMGSWAGIPGRAGIPRFA